MSRETIHTQTLFEGDHGLLYKRSKHIKGSKECYLFGLSHNLQIFVVISLIKLQNDKQQLNGEKRWKMRWKAKSLFCFWLSYVVFLSSAWKNVSMRIMCFYLCVLLNDLYIFGWARLFSCPVLGRMLALQSCAFIYVSDFYYTESFGKSTTTKTHKSYDSYWKAIGQQG